MRKFLISVLLASAAAATPALADPDHDNGRWHQQQQQQQGDRGQAHQERQQARDQGRAERPAPQVQMHQQVQVDSRGFQGQRFERVQNVAPQQVVEQQQALQRRDRGNWSRNGFDGREAQQVEQQQQQQRWSRQGSTYYGQRQVVQQQSYNGGRWANGGWNTNWRNDHRYDWRDYRNRHRSIFHLGIYFDPFGYGYQPFGIGYQLTPAYYGQQYWIDPAMYSLPFPPPGTEWVRYWNDALLVDVYSGQVIDVIHDFFW